VADGVERGAGLAFGGARAGGMGGVQAIGLELFVRRHKNTSQLQKSRRGLGLRLLEIGMLLRGWEIDCGMGRHCEMYSRGKLGRGDLGAEGSGEGGRVRGPASSDGDFKGLNLRQGSEYLPPWLPIAFCLPFVHSGVLI